MHIASNLRHLRRKANLTQEALSNQIGKTSITISDYEKGKSVPPLDVALKFCEIFNVDLDSLVRKDLTSGEKIEGRPAFVDYRAQYLELKKQCETLEQLNQVQSRRLAELEWMIRRHAPELAREIGLGKKE